MLGYEKAQTSLNREQKQALGILSIGTFLEYFDSPFGGTNLHLPDGEALACHVHHDALAS